MSRSKTGEQGGPAGPAANHAAEFLASLEQFEYDDEVYKGETEEAVPDLKRPRKPHPPVPPWR